MGVLIITLIAAVLTITNVIGPYALLGIVLGSLALMFIYIGLYFKFGFLKIYYHDILGWHTPDDSTRSHDGCSYHATCKHCGKDIMQDSQGNWF